MRTALGRRPIVLIFLVLSAALVAVQSNAAPQERVQHKLTKKELTSLVKNARTASDHRLLAAYYRQEAERLMKRSKEHEELAGAYANRTVFEPKTGLLGGLVHHCREVALFGNGAHHLVGGALSGAGEQCHVGHGSAKP